MGTSRGRNDSDSGSSSGEEDGDADWKAAIDSIASSNPFAANNGLAVNTTGGSGSQMNDMLTKSNFEDEPDTKPGRQLPKHYQIKAQKLLDEIIERNLEILSNPVIIPEDDIQDDGVGIQLFKGAPPGIVFDRIDEPQGPRKKPRILPGEELDEKSRKFRRRLQSAVVDGTDVIAAARVASEKSLARLEARDTAVKAATRREAERIAELKRIRGERWLPSIAKEVQLELQEKYSKV